MPDKYVNFAQLAFHELGDAYHINSTILNSSIALIAPHGGKIEPGTSEICRAVAGDELTHYLFEGCKRTSNSDLHITSARFDEPQAIEAARSAQVVVTIHGQAGDEPFVNVGGRDKSLGQTIIDLLNYAGYRASRHPNPNLQGMDPSNICNRGQTGLGIQLEISRSLRDRLCTSVSELDKFATTMQDAFRQHGH